MFNSVCVGSYVLIAINEDFLKHAEGEARAVKQERDQTSLAKLATEEDRPSKKPKTSGYQRYDSDHKYTKTYVTSQHSTAPRVEENTAPPNVDPPPEKRVEKPC